MSILDKLGFNKRGETLENINKVNAEHAKFEAAIKNADSVFAEFERMQDGINLTPVQMKAEMRMPEKLFTRISDRLVENGITPKKWRNEPSMRREKMLENAFYIALEEMQVPEEIRSKARILQSDLSKEEMEATNTIRNGVLFESMVPDKLEQKIFGDSRYFIGAEMTNTDLKMDLDKMDLSKPYGGQYELNEDFYPIAIMPDGIMYELELEKALKPMICQALMVMEQASLLEPEGTIADAALQRKWLKEILDRSMMINSNNSIFESARELVPQFIKKYEEVNKAKK